MKRFLFLMLLGGVTLLGATIDGKIATTAKQIKSFDQKYNTLHSKMARTAKEILEQKSIILQQQKKLQQLSAELAEKEESYQTDTKELDTLSTAQEQLAKVQAKVEQELVFAIARNVSLSMLTEDEGTRSAEAMITEEVIKKLTEETRREIDELNREFGQNTQRMDRLKKRTVTLKEAIDAIDAKRNEQLETQKRNKASLAQLENDEKRYKRSIQKLLDQQNELKRTLAHLNVIKQEKVEQAKEEAERKRQEAALKQRKAIQEEELPDVRQVGSSFKKSKTIRYRGKKTIAPLDSYDIVKKYGPYTDPIYHIKIFNESVSLRPKSSGAKVKNVLNGKIIFAKETAILDKVVVVEHSNGIHTIYANLDKIAPTLKVGAKVKKGYVIGRVNDELIFEVTQKNYHIDPLQLIN